ncbi:unnamed protein product [Alternaria alternata]
MVLSGIHPFPGSPDLGRLIQDRLKIVNQQFPALAPDTLDDFRIVADELSTIARICQTTINRLPAQSETYTAVEAFKDTERALDWAGWKKSRELHEQVNFVIFDLQALRQTPETTVFRVTDVLRFLETSKQTHLIPTEYQQWARNCDEYVIMGRGIEKGIVQITPWSELRWTPIINDTFCRAYTLSLYERFQHERMGGILRTECRQACEMVVSTARIMAGQKTEDIEFFQHLVHLILKPGLRFWGIQVSEDDAEIVKECDELLGDGLAARMSQISV